MSNGISDLLAQAQQRSAGMQPFSMHPSFRQAPPPVRTPFFQAGAPPLAGVLAQARPDLAANFANLGRAAPMTQPGTDRPPDFTPPGFPGNPRLMFNFPGLLG